MRKRLELVVMGFALAGLATALCFAQQKPETNDSSLGDIARQLNAQKAKTAKPAKVITNDSIPALKDGDGIGTDPKEKASTPAEPAGSTQGHDEKYFRSRLSSLQNQLDTHKRELEVLQQKLGQNNMQYYPDPNKSLQQQYSREDINKLTADINAKKQQVADDEKAIDDLHEQLRHENGDPGWLR